MKKITANQQRILNCNPSKKTELDFNVHNAVEAGVSKKTTAIPDKKDLRDNSWWPIGNQERTGSCVGWASADGVLRWHLVQAGLLKKTESLSVRFQWMASKETDELKSRATTFIESSGTSLKAALDIAKKYGTVLENTLPFSGKLSGLSEQAFYALAATRRINSYFNLFAEGDKIDNVKNWIANNGPVLARLDIDRNWNDLGKKGLLDAYDKIHTDGGHAVTIVGYTKDRLIIRNSWGTDWGDKGFAYATHQYFLAAFTEAYGVSI